MDLSSTTKVIVNQCDLQKKSDKNFCVLSKKVRVFKWSLMVFLNVEARQVLKVKQWPIAGESGLLGTVTKKK